MQKAVRPSVPVVGASDVHCVLPSASRGRGLAACLDVVHRVWSYHSDKLNEAHCLSVDEVIQAAKVRPNHEAQLPRQLRRPRSHAHSAIRQRAFERQTKKAALTPSELLAFVPSFPPRLPPDQLFVPAALCNPRRAESFSSPSALCCMRCRLAFAAASGAPGV